MNDRKVISKFDDQWLREIIQGNSFVVPANTIFDNDLCFDEIEGLTPKRWIFEKGCKFGDDNYFHECIFNSGCNFGNGNQFNICEFSTDIIFGNINIFKDVIEFEENTLFGDGNVILPPCNNFDLEFSKQTVFGKFNILPFKNEKVFETAFINHWKVNGEILFANIEINDKLNFTFTNKSQVIIDKYKSEDEFVNVMKYYKTLKFYPGINESDRNRILKEVKFYKELNKFGFLCQKNIIKKQINEVELEYGQSKIELLKQYLGECKTDSMNELKESNLEYSQSNIEIMNDLYKNLEIEIIKDFEDQLYCEYFFKLHLEVDENHDLELDFQIFQTLLVLCH